MCFCVQQWWWLVVVRCVVRWEFDGFDVGVGWCDAQVLVETVNGGW